MRTLIALCVVAVATLFVAVEVNAQSRPQFSPNAGYCPEGTHPRAAFGGSNDQVSDVTRDCVPDQPQPKKKKH